MKVYFKDIENYIKETNKKIQKQKDNFYKIGCIPYAIEIYDTPHTIYDFNDVRGYLKYYCDNYNISFLIIYSTTDSKNAKPCFEYKNTAGRPKKYISGDKVDGHIHCLLVGNKNKSAYSYAHKVANTIYKNKKKRCKVVSVSDGEHFYNKVCYMFRQADKEAKSPKGSFDFKEYVSKHKK